jgi:hypothetical protein
MEAGAGSGDELPDLSGASNVLLLNTTGGAQARTLCFDALTEAPPDETHVLAVTYTGQPAEWVDAWNESVGEQPASGGIVSVGQSETDFEDDTWAVGVVENPGDLTGTGIELSELLSDLDDSAGPDEQVVVCFDSVTALLQYADLQQSFRFLHVVTGRVRNADARCFYHLDSDAHDEQTMATLAGLFDTTVEHDGDGWTTTR